MLLLPFEKVHFFLWHSGSVEMKDHKVTSFNPNTDLTVLQVFQVLNEKKQLYAVKYVNLEEADQQTVDSYKNEIAHLSKLQQHSDKIIRLYN